jgi:TolA-binding protein
LDQEGKNMHTSRPLRQRLLAVAALILLFGPAAMPAHAVSKEMVELQTQVQQLLDAVQRLQSTLDARMGVLEHLAQQASDQATQVTATVTALQQKINAQNDAVSGKVDAVSGQVQSLNDSVDELKARVAKLDKSVEDLQAQLQAMQAAQTQPGATGPGATGPGGEANPGQGQGPGVPGAAPGGTGPGTGTGAATTQQAPPLQETLQAGVRDYNAGRYQVAQGEFQDVVHYYPLDDVAGTAQFYLGEIAYQQKDYDTAINDYNALLEGFSGNAKVPAAQLHKGFALIAQDKREEGIHELRSLIQRHPQTPEARAARTKLAAMGVKTTTTAPAH